ncbi:MAG: oligoribonuclease [Propionibacterium sp.]|nr:oligoribonuclease [Propionibacterium sp.]
MATAYGVTRRPVGKLTLVNDYLVWIDCEMTGLDLEADGLVEVAALVTDGELNVLGEGIEVVIKPSNEQLANMGEFVTEMHTKSGLLDLLDDGVTVEEAEQQVLAYIKQFVPTARKVPLAGNTIGTDRAFLAKYMPELEQWLHYRNVDVSSIKELAKRWYSKVHSKAPAKGGNHRALADIQESIEELRYYREAVFAPSPGPTAEELREVALKHAGTLTGSTEPAPDAEATTEAPATEG